VNFVLTNHFRERQAKLGRAHRSSQSDHHFSAAIEMRYVGIGGVFEDGGVEVSIVAIDELADAACLYRRIL
jgi:hypothetical protein